ncbi:hypothetical protein JHN49_21495 [Streptomyces sp. MBT57]|nr:hypothetical protein [Streptomyces sp. MBT57]
MILTSFGLKHGPPRGVNQHEALPHLIAHLENEGIFFAYTYPPGLEGMARYAAGEVSDFNVHHFSQYMTWANFAYSQLDRLKISGSDQIRALRVDSTNHVDFMAVDFTAVAHGHMPSFICFGDQDIQLAAKLNEFGVPIHTGNIKKPRDGKFSSRVKHLDLTNYGTLIVQTDSNQRDLIGQLIHAVSPNTYIEFTA